MLQRNLNLLTVAHIGNLPARGSHTRFPLETRTRWEGKGSHNKVLFGVSIMIAQYLSPPLLRAFLDEKPRPTLAARSGNASEIMKLLLDNSLSTDPHRREQSATATFRPSPSYKTKIVPSGKFQPITRSVANQNYRLDAAQAAKADSVYKKEPAFS